MTEKKLDSIRVVRESTTNPWIVSLGSFLQWFFMLVFFKKPTPSLMIHGWKWKENFVSGGFFAAKFFGVYD